MGARNLRWIVAALAIVLLTTPLEILNAQNEAPPAGNPTEAAPQSAAQLQSLVAPIALYPDSLVAMILTASTFPDQVAVANYWLQQNKSLTGSALVQAADGQTWDASVKALTAFPSVLENMAKNLNWTSSLGEAYHDQQSEVMTAIQTCRAQAKAQGNLKSGSQITVTQQSPDVIVIQPANPQVVYVPTYNPAVIYGYPYVVPGYVAPVYTGGDVAAAGLLGFGAGIAVGAMFSGGCCSWGYSSWNCGWHGTAVVYHGGAYYGNSAWHGGYYNGGYHPSYGYNSGYAHPGGYNTYNSATNTYTHNGYNGQTASRGTYNPATKSYSENSYNRATGISQQSSTNYDSSTHTATTSTTYSDPNRPGSSSYTRDTSTAYNPSTHSTTTTNSYGSSAHDGSNSWAQGGGESRSGAFSGTSGHSGGFGDSGGWASRADSSRGWGSMRSSGFSGGRFGGSGGFGGGRFGGGGFRR
jgi:uncharacterized membrane protein YgcG